jgi:hypothetical protein
VRRGDEVVQALRRGVEREIAPRHGEVARSAAIEASELDDVVRGEPLNAAVGLGDEGSETRPACAAILDEAVDRRHAANLPLRNMAP